MIQVRRQNEGISAFLAALLFLWFDSKFQLLYSFSCSLQCPHSFLSTATLQPCGSAAVYQSCSFSWAESSSEPNVLCGWVHDRCMGWGGGNLSPGISSGSFKILPSNSSVGLRHCSRKLSVIKSNFIKTKILFRRKIQPTKLNEKTKFPY